MRPAQLTPENLLLPRVFAECSRCFNEAGAINAGKHQAYKYFPYLSDKASMRPAQLTPENGIDNFVRIRIYQASMRPAQLTPENGAGQEAKPRMEVLLQ